MATKAQFAEFIAKNVNPLPKEINPIVQLQDAFGEAIDTGVHTRLFGEGALYIVSEAYARILLDVDADDVTTNDDGEDRFSPPAITLSGFAIVPLLPDNPQLSVSISNRNALRNTLEVAGGTVEYEVVPVSLQAASAAAAPAAQSNGAAAPATKSEFPPCDDCGGEIVGYQAKSGRWMDPKSMMRMSQDKYKKNLCKGCNGKRFAASRGN